MKNKCKIEVKVVVFDLGNVLFDFSLEQIACGLSLLTTSHTKDELLKYFVFPSEIICTFEKGEISGYDFFEKTKETFSLNTDFEGFKLVFNNIFNLRRQMVPIINDLRLKKIPLYLLSNTNELHFKFLKETFPEVLALFNGYILSYEVGFRKPQQEIYAYLKEKVAVDYGQIFFVDDLPDNVVGAQSKGIQAHHFKNEQELLLEVSAFWR